VVLQTKGQLHGGAQGVLPRHKNIDCKSCVKESWERKRKRETGTIGLTIYGPLPSQSNTWWEKQLAKEENGNSGSGNGNPGSGNGNPGEEEDR
jgi:hypothetical protein